MTAQQIADRYEIIWDGRGYLCIPPQAVPVSTAPLLVDPVETLRDRILRAMPGTLGELMARTGCEKYQVYAVLAVLRQRGQIVTTRVGQGRVVYSIATGGR